MLKKQVVAEKPECREFGSEQNKPNNSQEIDLVSTQALREYLAVVWQKYQLASKDSKSSILDELVRNLGIHRKSAIRLMNKRYRPRSLHGFKGGRRKCYTEAAKQHLARLWKQMGYMGPVRMKAAIPNWIEFYEHKDFDECIKSEILNMSESSLRRFLAPARAALRKKTNSGTRPGLRRFVTAVPIRNLSETPREPGHCEIDCVAHCGNSLSGTFVWTLTLTDIATGWTECESLWGKSGANVRTALGKIEKRLPFPLLALYMDNGSEFMNHDVIESFAKKNREQAVQTFRGRPYRKNDQCYVEQKNYTHVRQLFGYGRIDWQPAAAKMNRLYRNEWSQLQNLFMPQQKLTEKIRVNAKVIRKMDSPRTPFERLRPFLSSKIERELEAKYRSINPIRVKFRLTKEVRNLFGYLKEWIDKSEWGKMAI